MPVQFTTALAFLQEIQMQTDTAVDYTLPAKRAKRALAAAEEACRSIQTVASTGREAWREYGAALLEQREKTPSDKLFGQWVCEEGLDTGLASSFQVRSDAMWLAANWDEVSSTIRAADSRVFTTLHRPDHLRQACRDAGYSWAFDQRRKAITMPPKSGPAKKKVGLPAAVLESAGVHVPWGIRVNSSTKEVLKAVEDEYGKPLPKDVIPDSKEAEEVVAAFKRAEIKANPKAHRPVETEALSLPEQYQQQVDRAINIYKVELQVAEEKRLVEAKRLFDEELKKQVADLRGQLTTSLRENREEIFVWQERSKTLDKWMSEEEFKLVLGCLHPDKHHGSEQARFSRAFDIFNRLKQHIEPDKRKLKTAGSLWGSR